MLTLMCSSESSVSLPEGRDMKTSRILPEGVGGGRSGIIIQGRRGGQKKEWERRKVGGGEEEEGGERTNLEWLWHIQVASLHVL